MVITLLTSSSPSKGVPERQYQFDLKLYDEIIPEVGGSIPAKLI
jgi:hypothetical protein